MLSWTLAGLLMGNTSYQLAQIKQCVHGTQSLANRSVPGSVQYVVQHLKCMFLQHLLDNLVLGCQYVHSGLVCPLHTCLSGCCLLDVCGKVVFQF